MSDAPVERCYWRIGRNIRAERKRAGYTQEYVALLLRRSRNSVARIEIGYERIMLHTVLKIARILRCTPTKLTKGVWR